MTPTSLDLAGFTPAEGSLSSPSSSFGNRSQNGASDTTGEGPNFRQVMNSYARSHEDHRASDSKPKETKQAASDGEAGPNEGAAASAEPASPQRASSFTGAFGLPKAQGQPEGEAEQAPENESGVATQAGNPTPGSGTATPLSAMQILLNGGSLAQILAVANQAAANQAAPVAGQTAVETDAAGGNAKAGGNPLAGMNGRAVTGEGAALAGVKTGKLKGPEAKHKREADGTGADTGANLDLLGANNSVLVAQQEALNAAERAGQGSAEASKGGIPVVPSGAAEALKASAAGQNENAAKAAATNFAFAVRLNAGEAAGVATEHPATNAIPAPGASAFTTDAQHAVASAAGMADTGGAGAHAGEHQGEMGNGAEMMLASEPVPAGQTGATESYRAAQDAAPVAAAENEVATTNQPVRNVKLQLEGENNQRVDIRLVEVAGEMRVSVRAGDTKLTQTLQENIPDLAKSLDGQHVRAEIWTPRTESSSQAGGANQGNSNQGGQSSRGGDTPGQGGQQRQGRQQQNQPDWVDEFENYSSPTTTTRTTNTRSN